MQAMEIAWSNRKTSATDMNDQSSRSHCVVRLVSMTMETSVSRLCFQSMATSEIDPVLQADEKKQALGLGHLVPLPCPKSFESCR